VVYISLMVYPFSNLIHLLIKPLAFKIGKCVSQFSITVTKYVSKSKRGKKFWKLMVGWPSLLEWQGTLCRRMWVEETAHIMAWSQREGEASIPQSPSRVCPQWPLTRPHLLKVAPPPNSAKLRTMPSTHRPFEDYPGSNCSPDMNLIIPIAHARR
jgi:hypothetical protein